MMKRMIMAVIGCILCFSANATYNECAIRYDEGYAAGMKAGRLIGARDMINCIRSVGGDAETAATDCE